MVNMKAQLFSYQTGWNRINDAFYQNCAGRADSDYFYPLLMIKENGKGLSRSYMRWKFKKAISILNLEQPRKIIGGTNFSNPTRHSLRHSFAVNTLKRIKQQGKSPQNALPVLAAYMGHSEYKYTTKYLRVLDAKHRRQMLDFSMLRSEDV